MKFWFTNTPKTQPAPIHILQELPQMIDVSMLGLAVHKVINAYGSALTIITSLKADIAERDARITELEKTIVNFTGLLNAVSVDEVGGSVGGVAN